MADEIIIETTSAEVIEVGTPGPQGPAGAAGTGLETLTTQGDTLYRGAATGERLPIGTVGQILKVSSGGIPEWGAAPASGVSSVNGETGAVTLTPADLDAAEANHTHNSADLFFQGLEILGAGNANTNGVFVYSGDYNGKGSYHKDKDSIIYWDGAAWMINHNTDDIYSSAQNTTTPWQVTSWSVESGQTSPAPSSWDRLTGDQWEAVIGQRTNPTLRGTAAGKNVGTGANDVAAGNHTHSAATQSVAGFLSTTDKTKLDGLGTASTKDAPATGNASSTQVVLGNDTRLSDSRSPSSHAASHAAGGSDPVTLDVSQVASVNGFGNVWGGGETLADVFSNAGNAFFSDQSDFAAASHTHTFGTTAGTFTQGNDARLSDSRTPTSHAASHAAAGSDPVTPAAIGAQSIFVTEDIGTITANVTLTAARAKIYTVTVNTFDTPAPYVELPTTSILAGDVVQIRFSSFTGRTLQIRRAGNPFSTMYSGQQATFIAASTSSSSWAESPNNRISVGASSGVPIITGADAYITAGAFGTSAGQFAEGNHSHGNINSSGQVGSTSGLPLVTTTAGAVTALALGSAGQVLTVNSGANGVEFAAASGGGVTGAASSASDVLGVSGANITGVDAGSDKIVFWDDSASELTYLTVGSGLSLTNTELTATATGGGTKTCAVFTAEHNQPPATAFATLDTRNSIAVLDFDDTTDESAVFVGIMPEGASLGSGLKIRLHWMSTNQTSNNVVWDVSLERMNTDLDSDSFDTIASGTAAANTTQSGILTVTEITLTTIDSVTAGDAFRLKVTRDANNASDNMSNDAELVAVEVRSAA